MKNKCVFVLCPTFFVLTPHYFVLLLPIYLTTILS
jgi:hypothetical protein